MVFHRANPQHIDAVRQRLSRERLTSYDLATRGDVARSLRLYEWNTEASTAFYAIIHVVEVVLRNAMNEQLAAVHAGPRGTTWLDDPRRLLERRRRQEIADAQGRIRRNGKPVTPGRVVAELPFGFWRYLLAARYEQTLWTPALRHAFPHLQPQRRRSIADRVERLHHLRNRIAHHEPSTDAISSPITRTRSPSSLRSVGTPGAGPSTSARCRSSSVGGRRSACEASRSWLRQFRAFVVLPPRS